jgi:hypothetical protein
VEKFLTAAVQQRVRMRGADIAEYVRCVQRPFFGMSIRDHEDVNTDGRQARLIRG